MEFATLDSPDAVENEPMERTDSRLCTLCCDLRPLDEFRRRSRNSDRRHGVCRSCHNAQERARRAQASKDRTYAETVTLAEGLIRARRHREFMRLALSVSRNIGAKQFAENLKRAVDESQERGRLRDSVLLMRSVERMVIAGCMLAAESQAARSCAEKFARGNL